MTTLDLDRVFANDAQGLLDSREKARAVHGSDIRAAGNEVEQAVRDYLKRMLPPRYYVTHGHLIDRNHLVSPQIDVIIADNFTLASLVTTQDGTEYVPATSVLAVGEVKSTYSASRQDYKGFHDKLTAISKMHRPLIENTAYEGIGGHTVMSDMVLISPHRYLNNLYSFLLCVDAGDFDFGKIRDLLTTSDVNHLPSTAVLLNRGIVGYGDRANLGARSRYPNEAIKGDGDWKWCYAETIAPQTGTVEGANLSLLYAYLVQHLTFTRFDPPNIYEYVANRIVMRKSSLEWAS